MYNYQPLLKVNTEKFLKNTFSLIFLLIFFTFPNILIAQTIVSPVQAASLDAASSTIDSLLPSLPIALIAGLALIFAIRERSNARECQNKLEEEIQVCKSAVKDVTRYRAILDHSNIGLWQVDIKGMTLYANCAMCELLDIKNIEEIKDISDRQFLWVENFNKNLKPSYRALLIDKSGDKREVLIFEQNVVHDETAMSIKTRTVIDLNSLSFKQPNARNKVPREEQAVELADKFITAA